MPYRSIARHARPVCTARAVLLILLLLGAVHDQAWAQPPARDGGGTPPPVRHRIGVYVTDLHALDLARGTFGATFWVWAVGPDSEQALRTMEFANAERTVVLLESTLPRRPVSWSQRKVTGTFRHNWDLRAFPFDRPSLEILLEEGVREEDGLAYEADAVGSGYAPLAPVAGWRVAGMRVEAIAAVYPHSFGDPAAVGLGSRFSRLRAVLALERVDHTGFLKLTAALYAGVVVCAIGCLMRVTPMSFAPRITLLVASLFALVINLRAASVALGSEHGATLIDWLHLAGLAYVVAVTAVTVLVRARQGESGEAVPVLVRLERWSCLGAAALFVLANAWLILRTAAGG